MSRSHLHEASMQRTGSLQFSYILQEREKFAHARNERSRRDYEARQIIHPYGAGQPVSGINLETIILRLLL